MNPISLTITGKSIGEVNSRVLEMADEIKAGQAPSAPEVMYGDQTHASETPAQMPPKPKAEMKFNLAPEAKAQDVSPAQSADLTTAVDSEGFPWDERIHSGNKEKTTDGAWRKRRGVDPAVVAQVKAELSGAGYGKKVPAFGSMKPEQYNTLVQQSQQSQPAAPAPQLAVVPPIPTTAVHATLPQGVPMQQVVPAPVTTPTFAPPAPAPVQVVSNAYTPQSFRDNLMTILSRLAAEKKITHENIQSWMHDQFGGKEIQHWSSDVETCDGLYNAMIEWGWIVRA